MSNTTTQGAESPSAVERPWLASYPAGAPATVQWQACPTLKALFELACGRFAERPAFTSMGSTLTYEDAEEQSRDFAAWLQHEAGLTKGDRVAVMLPNCLQHPVVVFGALRAGMAVVNVNPLYTPAELNWQLRDSGAAIVVVLENFAHTVEQAIEGTRVRQVVVTQFGDLFPLRKRWLVNFAIKRIRHAVKPWHLENALGLLDALSAGAAHALLPVDLRPGDLACLQYTGGTTGRPKGAMLTHANLVANVEQVLAWTGTLLKPGEETVITALPLYHVFALTTNLLVFVRLGGHNVLVPDPRDMRRFVSLLKHTPFTAITGVNTLFDALMNAPGFEEVAGRRRHLLKIAVAGGMALQPAVSDRWQQAFGKPIVEGYGLTEASPIVCANLVDADRCSGMLGLPVPSTDVAIVDDAGRALPLGETGEIAVRGPQVMAGYWNSPEETARAITADGWLLTGDIGRMDEHGFVKFVDRKKDLIVVSGMKAFPAEIEDAMRRHPGVQDAAAVGAPDSHSGEAVVLYVIRRDASVTAEELHAHARSQLAGYKCPRRIEFRQELPRTALGKVLHRQLKDEAAKAVVAEEAGEEQAA